ncbi:hypothetical protein [Caballeronia sp. S22]|uniref:hypothetical protein n=1 Tax=Caballeronia sp. S22 TaxID=3137182 RepID=UPI0035311FCA
MRRISTATRVVDKFGAGKDGFTNGNAVGGIAATDLEDVWFDHVQEEIANVVEGAGLTLDASNRAQLLAAIQTLGGDGQCRLTYTSATVVTLLPENGNALRIGGSKYTVPSAGVTLSNSGLSASTLYWVYAIVSAGAIALQASTTGFTRQSDGRYTMTGNASARLVGAVYTNASSQFVSSGTNQNVVSFFNRRALPFNLGGAGGTTTSTTLTPVNSGTVSCISFGLDSTAVQFLVNGYSSVSAGSWASGILVDGASGASTQGLATSAAAAQINNNPSMFSGYLSAGYHTLAGSVNVNTGGGSITVTGSMIGQTWG